MYWKFNTEKFAEQQLPPLLRTRGIKALLNCLLAGLDWIQKQFAVYHDEVAGRLAGNGFTINLENFLNSRLISAGRSRSDGIFMDTAFSL